MGNDGGSIAKRRDLARQKKFQSRISCSSVAKAKANLCSLSQEPLSAPVVACKLGFLYNKEALLNSLLKNSLPSEFSHIQSLKDVTMVNIDTTTEGIMCPVSRVELNGVNEFKLMWNCGCLISEKALREVPSEICLGCNAKITKIVKIGQNKEEQKKNRKELGKRRPEKSKNSENLKKKPKIFDEEEVEKKIEESLKSDVYKSLFSKSEASETFCCRNLRAGLR